jgi:hypothetical protein
MRHDMAFTENSKGVAGLRGPQSNSARETLAPLPS